MALSTVKQWQFTCVDKSASAGVPPMEILLLLTTSQFPVEAARTHHQMPVLRSFVAAWSVAGNASV